MLASGLHHQLDQLYHHHHHCHARSHQHPHHQKVEQREEGDSISTDSLALVQRYNDIIASLTEAFTQVLWIIMTVMMTTVDLMKQR